MAEGKPTADIVIRRMREDDCAAVSRLQCASFDYGARLAGSGEQEIAAYCRGRGSPEAMTAQIEQCHCLVACRGDEIVGVVGVKGGEITKLYVDPGNLRGGIGAVLFRAAEESIAESGFRAIFLGAVFPRTLAFYRAMGMTETGRKLVDTGPMAGAEVILLSKPVSP